MWVRLWQKLGGGVSKAKPNLRADSSKGLGAGPGGGKGMVGGSPSGPRGGPDPAATPPLGLCVHVLRWQTTRSAVSVATKAGSSMSPSPFSGPGHRSARLWSHQALLPALPTASRHLAALQKGPALRLLCGVLPLPASGQAAHVSAGHTGPSGPLLQELLGPPRSGGPGAALRPRSLPTGCRLGGRVGGAPQGQGCRHVHPLPAAGLLSAASPWGPPRGRAPPPLGRPWGSRPSWASAWPS